MEHKTKYNKIGIGVTVILTWRNQLLLAKRKGSHGDGTWDTPGGHLEPGETIIECAMRETFEETNIKLSGTIEEIGYTEDFFENEKKHYISCVVKVEVDGKFIAPIITEPEKFSTEWIWCNFSDLPQPLFTSIKNALNKYPAFIFG